MNTFHLAKRFLSLALLLSSVPAFAANEIGACKQVFSTNLTREQLQALQVATTISRHFDAQVFTGSVEGKPRTVVLLGEFHGKTALDSELGIQTIRQFQTYGLEGADVAKTWGGKALSLSVNFIMKGAQVLRPSWSKHSTTYDAFDLSLSRRVLESMKRDAADGSLAKELPPKQIEELLAKWEEIAKDAPMSFDLEAGHKPDLRENIGSVSLPVFIVGCLSHFAFRIYHIGNEAVVGEAVNAGSQAFAMVIGTGLAVVLIRLAVKYDIAALVLRFPLHRIMGNARDKTMTNNITKIFQQHPDTSTVLAIIGKFHMQPMGELLERESGFIQIPLDRAVPVESDEVDTGSVVLPAAAAE